MDAHHKRVFWLVLYVEKLFAAALGMEYFAALNQCIISRRSYAGSVVCASSMSGIFSPDVKCFGTLGL